MPRYVVQDGTGYVGILEHASQTLEAGDVVVLGDGREALVTARVGAGRASRFTAVLEVVIEPSSPDT